MGTATLICCALLVYPLYTSTPTTAEKTDREKAGLVGPVHVVRQETASISQKDGKPVEGRRALSRIGIYDPNGNLIETASARDGSLVGRAVSRYNPEGKRIEQLTYGTKGALSSKAIDSYDDAGKRTSSTTYDVVDGTAWPAEKHLFSYDEKGNLTEDVRYDRDGSVVERWSCVYTYDSDGKPATQAEYKSPDLLIRRSTHTRETDRERVEVVEYNPDGSLRDKNVNSYDSKGNLIERVMYDETGRVTGRSSARYSEESKLVERSWVWYEEDGTVKNTWVDHFDAKGNTIGYTQSLPDGSIQDKESRVYELDAKGNWIKETYSEWVTKEGRSYLEPSRVIYRTIAYYDDAGTPTAESLCAELRQFGINQQEEKSRLRVELKLYADRAAAQETTFLDRSGATLPKSVHYVITCTRGASGTDATLSGGLYDPTGHLVRDLSGNSTDGSGTYKGSYDYQGSDQPGVWTLRANCEKLDSLPASGSRQLHLYSGSGVSSYTMDCGGPGSAEESVLENRHVVAVFAHEAASAEVLRYLYQKDMKTSYTFSKANVGRFDYMYNRFAGHGEVTSGQSVHRTFSCRPGKETEEAGSGSLLANAEVIYPQNELSHGAARRLSIWEKRDSSEYERVWTYSPDNWEAADHTVGDADNDGQNEIVWVTSGEGGVRAGRIYVVERVAGGYQVSWTSERILSKQPRVVIADTDRDGANEIVVAAGQKGDVYVFEHDGSGYKQVASLKHPGRTSALAVGDFNGDGRNEIVTVCQNGILYEYQYNRADYVATATYAEFPQRFSAADMDSGDIDGDGFPELLVSGAGSPSVGKFVIIDYSAGSFHTTYVSENLLAGWGILSCAFGDVDNDGNLEAILGTDKLLCYECLSLSRLVNVWSSPRFSKSDHRFINHMIDVEDGDSDGLNEILFVKPTEARDGQGDPSMWGGKSGGPPFTELWTYDTPDANEDADHVHGLDTDSDSPKTTLAVEITLPSEDADWLEYRVHDMKVDPNIHVVFPILSGSLGSGKDERFHLEKGADERIANLKANTWHNFSADVSNYCMVYDGSSEADNVDGTVLAWVRFKESENVKFQDVGLWNDSNGNAASRIRYDIKKATPADSFTCLLVFTKGDKETVDHWMPGIKSGKLPDKSFAVSPDG